MNKKVIKNSIIRKSVYMFWILTLAFPIASEVSAAPFTDLGNGTIKDAATGLIWQKCSGGLNNDSTCSEMVGVTFGLNWEPAKKYCKDLTIGQRKDWRLPTIKELLSIVDYSKIGPTIDSSSFPGAVAGNYWSSTAYAKIPADAWLVNFSVGNSNNVDRTGINQVRCVAGP